jgi:hypothetical protein
MARLGVTISVVTALLVVLSACSDDVTTSLRKGSGASTVLDSQHTSSTAPAKGGPSTSARPDAGGSDANPPGGTRSAAPTSGSGKPRADGKPKTTRLGTLNPPPDAATVGAPFDPCTVLTWEDFPNEVRSRAPKPREPSPRTPGPDSAFDIACAWLANGLITISADGSSTGTSGSFSTWVVWGKDMNAHPPDSTPAQFGPAQGSLVLSQTSQGEPVCTGFAALDAGGVAGVSTVNGKAPQVDTCGLVTDLLTRIATHHK